jgi:quercetin dioxygenase-like cupin family protein
MTECSIDLCKDDIEKLKKLTDFIVKIEGNNYKEIETLSGSCILYGLYKVNKLSIARAFAEAGTSVDFHSHESLEIIGVYEGRMEININGNKFVIEEGNYCSIDPNIPHSTFFPVNAKVWAVAMPSIKTFPKGNDQT